MKLTTVRMSLKLMFYAIGAKILPNFFVPKYKKTLMKKKSRSIVTYCYTSHYEDNQDFSNFKTDIKLIAYYLPQFHSFKENDTWWGKGFTEWSNTKTAKQNCFGHYQPREPHSDIGYYNLEEITVMSKQAQLAKQHGIYGFCMYYYWFSGKTLMEKPLNNLLLNKNIDFPFCLCWANETWARRWNGEEKKILIKQEYRKEDILNFIKDISKYLKDKRYIKINNKPIILIYKVMDIPNPKESFSIWKKWCIENGIGEIEIWGVRAHIQTYDETFNNLVDREVEFPPHLVTPDWCLEKINYNKHLWINYETIVDNVLNPNKYTKTPMLKKSIIRAAMLGWDNSARYKEHSANIYNNFSLYSYYKWLKFLINYTRNNFNRNERFLFINAWNEWAEGTYLEPEKKYGYSNINVTSRAIFDLPFNKTIEPNSILIVCLESLGDIIACEPVIQHIKKLYPKRSIYWVTSVQYMEVIMYHPDLTGVIPIYNIEHWINFKNQLDTTIKTIDLHFHKKHYALAKGKTLYNNNNDSITEENYYNCGDSLLDIFSKVAGLGSNNNQPKFYISSKAKVSIKLPDNYIVIHTQSSENSRNWDIEKWTNLLQRFKLYGINVVEIGQQYSFKNTDNCIDATNLSSIHETAIIIKKAKLFIGIDSSMAHLANALNIPGVIILGKYRAFNKYMPYSGNYQNGKNAKILYAPLSNSAYYLPVEEVFSAAIELFNESKI